MKTGTYKHSEETREKMRQRSWKAKGLKSPSLGIIRTEETKEKIKNSKLKSENTFRGIKSNFWKGGISLEFWRTNVLKRDNCTCQICGLKDEEIIQADHIKPVSKYPELRLDIDNGRAICPNCHERKSIREKGNYKSNEITESVSIKG